MGDELRDADGVTNAADSIVEYAAAVELRDAGDQAGFDQKLDDIADYNRYDCVSTLRLRDWLLDLARTADVTPLAVAPAELLELEPSPLHDALIALAGSSPDRSADETAAAFAAAALDYHRREHKTFWWGTSPASSRPCRSGPKPATRSSSRAVPSRRIGIGPRANASTAASCASTAPGVPAPPSSRAA
jgi:hypothetical protein